MGKRARSNRPLTDKRLKVAADQGAPNTLHCDHSFCKRVQSAVTQTLLAEYKQLNVTQKEARLMLRYLPLLLCTVGNWPPRQLSHKQATALFFVFCLVCVDEGATGLRGQAAPSYASVAEQLVAARAAESESGANTE